MLSSYPKALLVHILIEHSFGGQWTHEKLERIRKYLAAYVKIMSKRRYSYEYVDAFAGTGYINKKDQDSLTDEEFQISLPELSSYTQLNIKRSSA